VIIPGIEEGAAKTGRVRADVTTAVSVFAATNRDELEFCRQSVSFYASTPSYRPVLAHHGWLEVGQELSQLAARGQWGDMPALITDDILAEFCTQADTPVGMAAALKQRYEGIADRIAIYLPFIPGDKDKFWRELAGHFSAGD
jgi:alkanesulfonate monooxygenase SsuD/methylene tetrahydromethanopterin reductase-like flavin-dependent oxidoreductase (luciferase family)